MNIFLSFLFVGATIVSGIFVVKEECPENEEYLLCGSACPFNCTNPQGPVTCSDDCMEGCFCVTGYLRGDNGTCVTPDQCMMNNQTICGENEEFLSCGSVCPLTCKQPAETPACGLACSMGCFCKSGYVRDEATNQCVTLDKCPAEQCFSQNETFDLCNANCEPSCEDPEPICVQSCESGCICAPGLLRDQSGQCVTLANCPPNTTEPGLLNRYMNVIHRILGLTEQEAPAPVGV